MTLGRTTWARVHMDSQVYGECITGRDASQQQQTKSARNFHQTGLEHELAETTQAGIRPENVAEQQVIALSALQ